MKLSDTSYFCNKSASHGLANTVISKPNKIEECFGSEGMSQKMIKIVSDFQMHKSRKGYFILDIPLLSENRDGD